MRMRKISLLCLLLILLALVLGGCSENPEMSDEPTETAPTEVDPTSTSADTEAPDDEAPEDDPVGAVEEVDFCIECHSDQTMLTQTADPEVEVESESEGEG
jgi:PBP1b-binding outer membrane lipoprotein LpoB